VSCYTEVSGKLRRPTGRKKKKGAISFSSVEEKKKKKKNGRVISLSSSPQPTKEGKGTDSIQRGKKKKQPHVNGKPSARKRKGEKSCTNNNVFARKKKKEKEPPRCEIRAKGAAH